MRVFAAFATVTTIFLSNSIAMAEPCTGVIIYYDHSWIPGREEPPKWYPTLDFDNYLPQCQAYAAQFALQIAKYAYPESSGYFDHRYDNAQLTDWGCGFNIYAKAPLGGGWVQQSGFTSTAMAQYGNQCLPPDPKKNVGEQCTNGPNPINLASGNKFQVERDYRSPDGTLDFTRYYNSQLVQPAISSPFVSALGSQWRSTYDRAIRTNGSGTVYVYRQDGKTFTFQESGSSFTSDADVRDRLVRRVDGSNVFIGWSYTPAANEDVELYDSAGKLTTITTRAGFTSQLSYTSGRLSTVQNSFGAQLQLFYDASGRLSRITDPAGQSYWYGYSGTNNVNSVQMPDGTSRTIAYDEPLFVYGADVTNLMTGITDESNNRYATYTYNLAALAIRSEHAGGADRYDVQYTSVPNTSTGRMFNALGHYSDLSFLTVAGVSRVQGASARLAAACTSVKSSTYDANGNATSKVDFNDRETRSTFNLIRNLETSRIEGFATAAERTISTQWHATYRLPTQIDEPGKRTTFTHDANGNVLTRTELDTSTSVARTWTYTYNTFGKVLTANGPRTDVSDVTTYTYYSCTAGYQCGQVNTITNAVGHVTTYNTYNAHGQPLTITDPNGVVTTLTYDLRQRLTSRTVGTEATVFTYWPTGLLKKATLPDGSYLEYTYDAAHRLTGINDADGNRIQYTLDNMGNRTGEQAYDPSNVLARTRTRVFDTLNQLSQEIGAAGTASVTTTYGYDNNGNQTSSAAPMSRNTGQTFDELNRLTTLTDPGSGVTTYGYNALDQLISVTDPKSLVTTYTYNALGDLKQQGSPDTGTTTNTYDSGGNLATSTDARSAISTYTYDALDRVKTTAFKVGTTTDQTITFNYDAGTNGKGRLTSASDASHSMAWTYDALGRVTGKSQVVSSITKAVGYGYSNGQLTAMTTPSGQLITYGYANNQIISIQVNGTYVLSNVLYQPFGPPKQWTWGNGTTSTRTYDQDGKITQIVSKGTRDYAYDDAFRITAITEPGSPALSWTYGYDVQDRLANAVNGATTLGYTYDANGNRLSQTGAGAATYTVSPTSNRVSSISGGLTRTYGYNAAGSTTTYGTNTLAYNNRGRMKSLNNGSSTTTYVYNAIGQLIQKTGALFVYDEAGHLLGQYTTTGALVNETVWMGDIPVATLRPKTGGGVDIYYIHTDHLNTPRMITRPSDNKLRWRWDSQPFGSGAPNDNPESLGTFASPLRFPGQIYFTEAGLHYNYFRDYDPQTGRYIQSDPIGLDGGLNTYLYADADPILKIDPTGEAAAGIGAGIAAGIGLGIRACMRIPACKKAVQEAIKDCKDVRCKFERHTAHHYFPKLGWCEHYSLTCWIKGQKGPPLFRSQWPFPGRCSGQRFGPMGGAEEILSLLVRPKIRHHWNSSAESWIHAA